VTQKDVVVQALTSFIAKTPDSGMPSRECAVLLLAKIHDSDGQSDIIFPEPTQLEGFQALSKAPEIPLVLASADRRVPMVAGQKTVSQEDVTKSILSDLLTHAKTSAAKQSVELFSTKSGETDFALGQSSAECLSAQILSPSSSDDTDELYGHGARKRRWDIAFVLNMHCNETEAIGWDYSSLILSSILCFDPMRANLTPGGSFVNVHVDPAHSILQLFSGMLTDNCLKLFLFAPASSNNLERFSNQLYSGDAIAVDTFAAMLQGLEGLSVVPVFATDVLLIPHGYLHAVFTIQSCFIIGPSFVSGEQSDYEATKALWELWAKIDDAAARKVHAEERAAWSEMLEEAHELAHMAVEAPGVTTLEVSL
jgi:hypothetical protein